MSRGRSLTSLFATAAVVLSTMPTLASAQSSAPTAADSAAIRATALDYIEGWYAGDTERMERAVHPELAKRIVMVNPSGRAALDQIGAMTLVQRTRRGGGRDTPAARQQKDVVIHDIFRNVASVRVTASDWIDYLHIARVNGRWVIVNVLWEMKAP